MQVATLSAKERAHAAGEAENGGGVKELRPPLKLSAAMPSNAGDRQGGERHGREAPRERADRRGDAHEQQGADEQQQQQQNIRDKQAVGHPEKYL